MTRAQLRGTVLATIMLLSVVAGGVAAAQTSQVSYSGDSAAPNPEFVVDNVTVSDYNMGWSSPLSYQSNDGDVAQLDGVVNKTNSYEEPFRLNNPYSFIATDINATQFGEFPRKSNEVKDASALDAGEWTTTVSDTTNTALSVTDVTTAPGVDAVEIGTGGSMGSNDLATATYQNFSITSDADKRYIQFAVDVTTLDSAAGVNLSVHDSDGDYVDVSVANSSKTDSYDVAATATGEGFVLQEQVGNLTVEGTGDGTMQEIVRLEVTIVDADATVQFAALNAEKMGEWTFGEKRVDTDTDDALETVTHKDPSGTVHVSDLSTLGPVFDSATIHDLSYPVDVEASELDAAEQRHYFNSTDAYPGFSTLAGHYYQLTLPDQYDLTWSNAVLSHTAEWPGERYVTYEYAEGAGDVGFHAPDYGGVTAPGSAGEITVLDATIQPGSNYFVHIETKLTDENVQAMKVSGGGAAPMSESGGGGIMGFFGTIWGQLTALAGGVLVFLGLSNRGG